MPAVLALQERFNFTSHAESPPLFYIHFFILRADGKVVPEKTAKNFVTLENWRDGFDRMAKGEGAKWVITIDEELE